MNSIIMPEAHSPRALDVFGYMEVQDGRDKVVFRRIRSACFGSGLGRFMMVYHQKAALRTHHDQVSVLNRLPLSFRQVIYSELVAQGHILFG